MQLQITSASGNILALDTFLSLICMTESGQITILPGHEPLLTALIPGILSIKHIENAREKITEYVSGGGVVNITPDTVTILSDVLEKGEDILDLEYIEAQKKEAQDLVAAYKAENGAEVDPRRLIAIEHDLLRYSAMHELGRKYQVPTDGSRK